MKNKRNGLFETNSSSTHCVAITGKENYDYTQLDEYVETNYLYIQFGEFGWEEEEYDDAFTKLRYLLTMIMETNQASKCNPNGIKCIEDFYSCKDFLNVQSIVTEHVKNCKGIRVVDDRIKCDYLPKSDMYFVSFNGYIDHQSCERYHHLDDFLNDYGVSIENFIFNHAVILETDNDNH